ncbi:uncharacterized protein LOC120267902 [Dioscorea cayenensis subsp. rotundata]|uniref:Uncharacterized protein LOC120267902 n=1 Tax=Dioscorea cayennensis subsp. rotundata TaxID=55577 RepID=A0AB40BVL7_DIOCR|nr:uncharacterized protein LOC120267902 [Dioscorea cayenensis subsp. rotundata]
MAKTGAIIICSFILTIDIVAGILGIEAEIAQNKGKHHKAFLIECRQTVHQAYNLGIAAVVLLAVVHTMINILGGCVCYCSKDKFKRAPVDQQIAAITFLMLWVTFGVGFSLLMIAATANSRSKVSCGLSRRHFLSIGGVLCFVHGFFCVIYYVSVSAKGWLEESKNKREVTPQSSIAGFTSP